MPIIAAAPSSHIAAGALPTCDVRHLSLSVDGKDGEFDGLQKSGTELSIGNDGPDCTLPALPRIAFLDARRHVLPVIRAVPVGMHPGPVMIPVRVNGGHRAVADLTWITGRVYANNRPLRVIALRVTIGNATLRTPLKAVINTEAGRIPTFTQPPLRTVAGMAAD